MGVITKNEDTLLQDQLAVCMHHASHVMIDMVDKMTVNTHSIFGPNPNPLAMLTMLVMNALEGRKARLCGTRNVIRAPGIIG